MKETYYLVTDFKMIDNKTLYSYEKLVFVEKPLIKTVERMVNGEIITVIETISGRTIEGYVSYRRNNYYSIEKNKKGVNESKTNLLPYFATVTEDLPGWCKWEPKVYENCQLTTDKQNGYLTFFHEPTNQKLKIALNSHTYIPNKK